MDYQGKGGRRGFSRLNLDDMPPCTYSIALPPGPSGLTGWPGVSIL